MNCPDCGLAVLVEHGAISPHLRPDDLQPCATPPASEPDADPKPPAAKKTAAKAPPKP
jgi:hypothetical protein